METAYVEILQYRIGDFENFTTLDKINHIYHTYREIENIDLEKNGVNIIKPYNTEYTLA